MSPFKHRTGYVVKVYPRFSETFVVTEILAREEAGEDLTIFALRPTTDARFHPQIAQVAASVHHLSKPTKLTDTWSAIGQAERELPDFATRFAGLLPFLTQIEATEAVQGITLALDAHRAGITRLHVHFASSQARVARIAAALLEIPYTVTTHAKDLFHESVDRAVLADVLGHADAIVAISDYNRRFITNVLPQVQTPTYVVRNGVDLDLFRYRDPVLPERLLRILAVGRLVEKKGFNVLIEAVSLAVHEGLDVDVRIAGEGELGPALQSQIDAAGLTRTCHLIGPRSQAEIRDLMGWADVLVAPCVVGADGNADGLPTVLLEAMATGVPCITTSVTGIPEAIHSAQHGEPATGILLEPEDTVALSQALQAIADPTFPRCGIALAARAVIERDYDTRRQSRLLSKLPIPVPVQAPERISS